MKIEDLGGIIRDFLSQDDSYKTILVDGSWGCGKTTQIRKSIKEIKNKKIVYVSLFGTKSTNELSLCYKKIGVKSTIIGNMALIGLSAVPFVGGGISTALSNVLDQFGNAKKAKKKKVFVFDDLERVDETMSLTSLLGFFNTLVLNGCKVLCLSALKEITNEEKRNNFDRFVEKAFDRVYHIDEEPMEIYSRIFNEIGITNLKAITTGFNGNIRLAKRTSFLYERASKMIESSKDNNHDFFKNYSKDELLFSAATAIRVLYLNSNQRILADKEKDSIRYMVLKEQSEYFGEEVSDRYVAEFIDKDEEASEFKPSRIQALTKDLIYIEMFENYSYLEEDSRIVNVEPNSEEASLFSESFYYLNDKDKKRYVSLLDQGIQNGKISVDSALMTMIGEVCNYSDLPISNKTIDIIVKEIVSQVDRNDHSTFEKASEQRNWVKNKQKPGANYVEIIFQKSKKEIDKKRLLKAERDLSEAYNSNNFKFLLDTYYELAEGKMFRRCGEYIDLTIRNNYFLPRLEKSINHTMWSYCHQISRYCKTAGIGDNLISYLKKYVKRFPNEESLKDKAFAMIFYNIDSSFKMEDLEDDES